MERRAGRHKLGAAVAVAVVTGVAIQTAVVPTAQATVTPSVVADSQVQNLINTVRGEPGTYAGLWIDDKTNTVYVSAPSSSVTAGSVAALEPRATTNAATMKIDVVHAKYNFAQLEAIDARVMKDSGLRTAAKRSHALVSEWYPDPETDKVVIGFTKVTAAEVAEVRAEYGSTARVIAAPVAEEAIGKVSTSKTALSRVRPQSRVADSAPWYGGDKITYDNGDYFCTSGYEFSSEVMSTAGHCGSDPTSFYNNGVYFGTTYTMQWGNGRIDMQLMNGSTYLPYIWAGSGGSNPEPVSGSGGVAQGGTYCTGGVVTGQNCSAVVEAIDICVEYSEGVDVCDLDEAYSSNGTPIIQPGDSGGPVYTSNSAADPYAVGTISGTVLDNGSCGCTTGFWSDMYMEKKIFGTSPEVG